MMSGSIRSDGSTAFLEYDNGLLVPFVLKPTTLSGDTAYFAMQNLGTNTFFILSFNAQTIFEGIPGANVSPSIFKFSRFRAATPSGGTNITPVLSGPEEYTHGLTYVQQSNGGLTVTGLTFDTPAIRVVVHNQAAIGELGFRKPEASAGFQLAPGDGLICRADGSLVSGAGISGTFVLGEKRF